MTTSVAVRAWRGWPASQERGQMALLVIGFAVILLALVAVVVDASQVVLLRRSLASLADGAAISAAQSAGEQVLYTQGAGSSLPLDPALARSTVAGYLQRNAAAAGLPEIRLVSVQVDGNRVEVALAARADLPLVGSVTRGFDGTVVTARAAATSPVR